MSVADRTEHRNRLALYLAKVLEETPAIDSVERHDNWITVVHEGVAFNLVVSAARHQP